ncbi:hypothetical protein DL98DRAFT_607168 [Cadophora sp. DSE1049]|nr:hypothetical protein DL98DRAFT_607168 [Cadophora sp. DSE1049]
MDVHSKPSISRAEAALLSAQPQRPAKASSNEPSNMTGEYRSSVHDPSTAKNTALDNTSHQGSDLLKTTATHVATQSEGDPAGDDLSSNLKGNHHHRGEISADEDEQCHLRFSHEISALRTRLQRATQSSMKTSVDLINQKKEHTLEVRRLKDAHKQELEHLRKKLTAEHEKEVVRLEKLVDEPKKLRSSYEKLQVENRTLKKKAAAAQASMDPLAKENHELKSTVASLTAEQERVKKALDQAKSQIQRNAEDARAISQQHSKSLEEYRRMEADLSASKVKVKTLLEEIEVTKSQKAEYAGVAWSLGSSVLALEKDQANKEPLVDIGIAIRMRHMVFESTKDDIVSREERKIMQAGNRAAHAANIEADYAVFMASSEFGEEDEKYFQKLHGKSPHSYITFEPHRVRYLDISRLVYQVAKRGNNAVSMEKIHCIKQGLDQFASDFEDGNANEDEISLFVSQLASFERLLEEIQQSEREGNWPSGNPEESVMGTFENETPNIQDQSEEAVECAGQQSVEISNVTGQVTQVDYAET